MRIFQKVATGILVVFLGLMATVCIVAYKRTSGATRQDMSEAHLIRKSGIKEPSKRIADLSVPISIAQYPKSFLTQLLEKSPI